MNLDPTLLGIFEAEQQEHVARMRGLLEPSGETPILSAPADLEEALRRAHTLKGAARAVGVGPTEMLAHRLETVFARIREGRLEPGERATAVIRRVLDAAEDVLASVVANRPEPETSGVLEDIEELLGSATEQAAGAARVPPPAAPQQVDHRTDILRVESASIDEVVRLSSQLLAAASGLERGARDASGLAARIAAMSGEWSRLRQRAVPALRKAEATPALAPLLDTVNYIDREIGALAREARVASSAQQRSAFAVVQLAAEQHRSARRVRMTPADTVFGGFGAMVRDLAREQGKEVEFRSEGLEVPADRMVLQALKDPVMHLLRNAVVHGIELPAERRAAGKRTAGSVLLSLGVRGDRLRVAVEDDGRGIDAAAVRSAAIRKGLLAGDAAAPSWQQVISFLLEPGFSTAHSLTRLAGRGIGMSVVNQAVMQMQGDLAIEPRRPCGTSLVLTVPLSISTQKLLLAACGGHTLGIPAGAIRKLRRVRLSEIESAGGAEVIRTESGPVPLARLADLLGFEEEAAASEPDLPAAVAVAILQSGGEQLGVIVDAFVDQCDAIVKETGLPSRLAGMAAGAVALADGRSAVVLNASALLESYRRTGKAPGLKSASEAPPRRVPGILVVDDSITTRSLEKSMLEAHGYRVRVAVDGVEALEQMRAEKPDLVISDIMMPRMDGLALLDQIRKDRDLAGIPVILVSSLDKREDQEKGLSLGADAYIVKQKFNQRELLNTIRQIL